MKTTDQLTRAVLAKARLTQNSSSTPPAVNPLAQKSKQASLVNDLFKIMILRWPAKFKSMYPANLTEAAKNEYVFHWKGLTSSMVANGIQKLHDCPENGRQSQKNSRISTASRSAQTTACRKQKAPGLNVADTVTGHRITDGLTLPYKKQVGRLAGQPLQATRKKAGLNDSLNTNLKPGLIKFWLANLAERPAPLWKIKAASQSLSQICDTTTRNSAQRSKSKGSIQRIARALKSVWRDSLRADERGETFWHNAGSVVAIVAFICLMIWILGNTPSPGEYRTHDVLVTTETGE